MKTREEIEKLLDDYSLQRDLLFQMNPNAMEPEEAHDYEQELDKVDSAIATLAWVLGIE